MSDVDLDTVADKVAKKLKEDKEFVSMIGEAGAKAAMDKFALGVGRTVIERLLWIVGAGALMAWAWFTGKIGPPPAP